MTQPATYDLTIRQGATWVQALRWEDSASVPVDLTGYTARMQVRPVVQSPTVIISLTTENGRITLGGATGNITLNLDAETTAAIEQPNGVYDLELESADGTVTALLGGRVRFPREVTRD
jgi:hypothetical protein